MFEPGKDPQPAPGRDRRRVGDSRKVGERREEIRFELKSPRRNGRNRRKHDSWEGPLR